MSTRNGYKDAESFKRLNSTPIRTTVESVFYGNNVVKIPDVKTAYELAKNCPGTVELTGMPIAHTEELGLPSGANVLLFNDGAVFGRCAAARRIIGHPGIDTAALATVIREAAFLSGRKKMYHGEAVVGLDKDLMIKANILIPEGYENNMLSWLVNFQFMNDEYKKLYAESRPIGEDADIFVYTDPDWSHPDFPLGLACFAPEQNCAAILGMRYFGEIKKGTLTLAWGIAARNGYASCHGGLKRFQKDGKSFVLAAFGLSGSGKSTITHAKHGGKYDITVLHDDALAVNVDKRYAIAMEPAYFDKMADYPIGCEDNKYLLTMQNCGVTTDADGKLIAVTEDMRNGNGRAMKSRYWSPNRVDRIDEPLNAICWLMKDPTMPPVLRLTDPALAAAMGATLATKRTSAERLAPGVDPNALVIESYANPFRTYPLAMDYERFKKLISDGVACYVLNTGDFMGKKVTKEDTFGLIEAIVDGTAKFKPFGDIPGMEAVEWGDFNVDFSDGSYVKTLYDRMFDRFSFVRSREIEKGGMDRLPDDAVEAIRKVVACIYGMAEDKSLLRPMPEADVKSEAIERTITEHGRRTARSAGL